MQRVEKWFYWKGYTSYATTKLSGIDITKMPTWQKDINIKVVGIAFASNEMNTDEGIII